MIKQREKLYTFWKEHELFILTAILFMPEYIFFPIFFLTAIYIIYEFFKQRLFNRSLIWIFIVYIMIVAYINHNMLGIWGGIYLVYLVMYASYFFTLINPKRYMELQYYIAWSSLFNFFFNFLPPRPKWARPLLDMIGSVIPLQQLPQYGHGSLRAFSTFSNPNIYGFVLLIVLLVAFNQIQFQWTFKNYSVVLFYVGVFIINMYALLITGTRAILPALAVGLMMIVIVQKKWLQVKLILLGATAFAIYILINPEIFPRFLEIREHAQIRIEIWEKSISEIKRHPWFGKGLFTYRFLFNDAPDAHNVFIDSLLSYGIIGSSLLLGYLWERLRYLTKYAYYLDYPLAFALLSATIFFGIFDIPLFSIQPSLLFLMIMCLPLRYKKEF